MLRSVIGIALAVVYSAPSFAEELNLENGWQETVPGGVYERANADGTIERVSLGGAGAVFERKLLVDRMEVIRKSKSDPATESGRNIDRRISEIQKMIDAIDHGVDAEMDNRSIPLGPASVSSKTGSICGIYGYKFDSDLTVTSTKATLKGTNTSDFGADLGPPLPQPTSALFSTRLEIGKSVGAPEFSVWSKPLSALPYDADGNPYLTDTIVSSSSTPQTYPYPFCTYAEFQATLKVQGSACNSSNDYVSWTKTYPTCVP